MSNSSLELITLVNNVNVYFIIYIPSDDSLYGKCSLHNFGAAGANRRYDTRYEMEYLRALKS